MPVPCRFHARSMQSPFLSPKSAPGTSKIIKIHRTVVKNQGFAIFSSDCCLGSILDPLGLPICSQEGPQSSQNAFKTPPRPPQERPRHAQERPRGLQDRPKSTQDMPKSTQEASKSAPTVSKSHQDSPKSAQDAPKSAQDASKRAPEPSKTQLAVQIAVQPLSRKQLQTCAPPTKLPTTEVCGGTREASYNPPHTFRCASAF